MNDERNRCDSPLPKHWVVERIRDLIPMRRLSLNSESPNEHSRCELRQSPTATTITNAEGAIGSHRFSMGE